MNSYEIKQEARKERLEARAARLRSEGEGRIARSREMASVIPFGQPILVGHHSEGRDRRYRGKIEGGFCKGFEALKAAGEMEAKAASVGSGGISSDNPEAVKLLQEKMERLQSQQVMMRAANALIRKLQAKGAGEEIIIAELASVGCGPVLARAALKSNYMGKVGFEPWQLSNNNAEISRLKGRIAQLQEAANAVHKEKEVAGVQVVENVEENRLQLIFPGKPPSEVIAELKSRGFRWAPSAGAWQRQLNNGARWAAECVIAKIEKEAS